MHSFDRFHTPHFEFVNYVVLDDQESREMWIGRNHPDVRKWMTHSEPFSYEDHTLFVQTLKKRNDRIFWAVKHDSVIIGAYILNPYDPVKRQAELGKFIFPSFRGKGFGKLVTSEFLKFMFDNDILNAIYAKTLIDNYRNQHINELMGFKKIGQDEKYVYMSLNKEDYNVKNNNCC